MINYYDLKFARGIKEIDPMDGKDGIWDYISIELIEGKRGIGD